MLSRDSRKGSIDASGTSNTAIARSDSAGSSARAARRYFLTAERFDAAEAQRLGLIDRLLGGPDTLAVIGAVIGEFVGSSEGLGYLLLSATSQLDTPLAFAALFALSALGIFAYALVGLGERMMSSWLPPAPARH